MQVDKPSNTAEMREHLSHVDYPVTGKEFMAACNNMSHANKDEINWVKQNILPSKTYNSPDEVKKALKI